MTHSNHNNAFYDDALFLDFETQYKIDLIDHIADLFEEEQNVLAELDSEQQTNSYSS